MCMHVCAPHECLLGPMELSLWVVRVVLCVVRIRPGSSAKQEVLSAAGPSLQLQAGVLH